MKLSTQIFTAVLCVASQQVHGTVLGSACRNVPGSKGYPSAIKWQALNATVSGRLVRAVPSAKFCSQLPAGQCSAAEFASAKFRNTIPGAMNQVNFEQDYDLSPPSICTQQSVATCGQGNVPIYAILAENVNDIQKGVDYARTYNLRLAIKASGHDYLGRSNAKNSLLIHTHNLQSISFTENFVVNRKGKGSAVTVGSGVGLSTLYTAASAQGKIVVGGTAATVVAAGGYAQGGGHSALSPTFGMASDNALQFKLVLANGKYVTANENENSDLFWALRGGGAGSWGVIVEATFRTYPTFTVVASTITYTAPNSAVIESIVTAHARRAFDWDAFGVGQYFYVLPSPAGYGGLVSSYFTKGVNTTQAAAALLPLVDEIKAAGATIGVNVVRSVNINAALTSADDSVGATMVMGSRLIPASVYRDSPEAIGKAYKQLLDIGTHSILGHFVAGGKVAENAGISSALHPAWRTAKNHLIVINHFDDVAAEAEAAETRFKNEQLPIINTITGGTSAAYSNEADAFEADFRTTFYGPNYARLSVIKRKYDPTDLFIVQAGVGSERWDKDGLCRA
ncbi:FAD-binding domain-containing protein [Crassisporium funariophilum]|nr:FAD-binding domain-containing protein [Crassisporium funariophilum]